MLVNAAQSHFKFDRFDQSPAGSFDSLAPLKSDHVMRKSPTSYHRRTVSCLAVASHHEHYDHPWYCSSNSRFYETIEIAEGSASPVHQTRHAKRKSEGAISLEHLQKSLSGAGVANVKASSDKNKNAQVGECRMVGVPSGPLGGKKSPISISPEGIHIHRAIMPHPTVSLRQLPDGECPDSGCFMESAHFNQVFAKAPKAAEFRPLEGNLFISIFDIDVKCDRDYHCTANTCGSLERAESTLIVGGRYNTLHDPQHFPVRPFSNPEYSHFDCSLFQKLAVASPVTPPRRSLLSDLLSSQGSQSRLEQNANRRRMLKSMRRYSVDASEMDFSVSRPSSRFKHLEGIPSEEEGVSTLLADCGRQGFSSTPTVRYLRNPCHPAVKTKLLPSAYRGAHVRRGAAADDETPDYFGAEDRVW